MKKAKILVLAAAICLAALFSANAQSGPRFRLEIGLPLSYDWVSLFSYAEPSNSTGLDSVLSGGASSLMAVASSGPFEFGLGGSFLYAYMTDFSAGSNHSLFDHDVMGMDLECRAEYALLPWLRPFVRAALGAYEVQVFNALHPFDGTDEYAFGGEAAIGICFLPYSRAVRGDSLSVIVAPRGTARWLYLANVGYGSIDAGADIGLRYEFK